MSLGADVISTTQKLNASEAEQLMRQIAANPNVEFVQVDRLLQHTLTPNDSSYSQQWGYFDADAGIRANQAWDVANGSGIIVAVLDTGHVSHSDLNANVSGGYDFINDATVAGDGNGRDSDPSDPGDYYGGNGSSWHGTHVAGTVAAVTNNAKGVAGTAWGATVMPVRVLGRGGGYTSDIADAIIWASGGSVSGVPTLSASQAADVINMSLGGSGSCDSLTQNAINSAVSRGTESLVFRGEVPESEYQRMRAPFQATEVTLARMVMPRSRSRSLLSIIRSATCWCLANVPAWTRSLSTSVVLP